VEGGGVAAGGGAAALGVTGAGVAGAPAHERPKRTVKMNKQIKYFFMYISLKGKCVSIYNSSILFIICK
jgi:hypothetical protein